MCFQNSMKKRDVGIQNEYHHPRFCGLILDKDKSSIVKSQETTEAFIWYVDTKRKKIVMKKRTRGMKNIPSQEHSSL